MAAELQGNNWANNTWCIKRGDLDGLAEPSTFSETFSENQWNLVCIVDEREEHFGVWAILAIPRRVSGITYYEIRGLLGRCCWQVPTEEPAKKLLEGWCKALLGPGGWVLTTWYVSLAVPELALV